MGMDQSKGEGVESIAPSTWGTELLRATAFYPGKVPTEVSDWWQRVTGEPFSSRFPDPMAGGVVDEGLIPDGKLSLARTGQRIDWVLSPNDSVKPDAAGPSLGPLPEVLPKFLSLLSKWSPTSPAVKRLAIGGALFKPVNDWTEGHSVIRGQLSDLALNLDGVRDFGVTINRSRLSEAGVAELTINRMLRWSAAPFTVFAFTVVDGRAVAKPQGGPQLQARVELDINTAGDFPGEIPTDKIHPVLSELAAMAVKVPSEGDRA